MGVPKLSYLSGLLSKTHKRTVRLLTNLGYLKEDPKIEALYEKSPLYGETLAASVKQRIATGGREGLPVRFIKTKPLEFKFSGNLCVNLDGFSLHAAVSIPASRRESLERLIRYMARPPVCTERLSVNEKGQVLYKLKRTWADGRTHVVFSPFELLEKLSALVPLPRLHLTRYSGVLAPNSRYRSEVIPNCHPQVKGRMGILSLTVVDHLTHFFKMG